MKIKSTLLLIFLSAKIFAQSSNFVTFGVEEGLIQSHVQALVQDDEGNLWIGTIGGLTKYNGSQFVNFTQQEGLSEDWITVSHKDKNGNLWFGHWGGGATVYSDKKFIDIKSEVFTKYKRITCIAEDINGKIYLGTENSGIAIYETLSDSTAKPAMIDEGLSSNFITALFADAENKLWIGTSKGASVYDIQTKKITSLTDIPVRCIASVFGNEIWLGTENSGIIRVKNNSSLKIDTTNGLPSNDIKTIFEDKEHIVWIGTKNSGIVQFIASDYSENSAKFVQGDINAFTNKFEMKYYNANVFFQDRENNLWVGSETGLHRYTGELFRIYNYNDGLVSNLVWSIMRDSKNNFWFATSDGVSKFTFPESNGTTLYSNPAVKNYTAADGLPENLVVSMCEDRSGNIWFGTQNNGACVLTKEIKNVRGREEEKEIFKKYSVKDGLADNNIFSICEDKDIWFGTRNGVSQLTSSGIKNYTAADGLGGNKVYKIFRDSKNNLWFGILGGYLTRYDGNSFKTFGENKGLKFVLSMDEDKNGNIWFGTYNSGLFRYDGKEFKNFTTADGMSSNTPLFVACDSENNIWLGQSRGIEKFQDGRFILYSRQQGFPGIETNENAVAVDRDKNIWFSAIKGVVKFSPRKEKISKTEPLTSITGVKLFLKEIPFQENFVYNENTFTFSALAVCLTNPKDVLYQYKLEGFDTDWQNPTSVNSVTYSNLPPGNYNFMVKANNGLNVWNENPVTHSFSIAPPFWETLWFRVSSVAFVVCSVILFVMWRERKLKQEKKILEQKVAERTRELRAEKEIVEKQNIKITESISYAKRIQEAMLPPMEITRKVLPEFFVFYKPKDIVSGDFYWIYCSTDSKSVLLAAVDCTGHGVPGAFMSIIGHNILERIVKEQKLEQPAEILNCLSKEVGNTLRKSGTAAVKDGMDIALVSIKFQFPSTKSQEITNLELENWNLELGTLEFAGANNPLYLIRKGELKEIKADKQSIGAQTDNKPFTNNSVELQKGDMLYIFTDGFPDQKGGSDKKKFYYAPFRKLLCDIHQLPMEEQKKQLEETIMQWMNGMEQYDDMLIFGVRV